MNNAETNGYVCDFFESGEHTLRWDKVHCKTTDGKRFPAYEVVNLSRFPRIADGWRGVCFETANFHVEGAYYSKNAEGYMVHAFSDKPTPLLETESDNDILFDPKRFKLVPKNSPTPPPERVEEHCLACDALFENGRFIHVLGTPLWLYDPVEVKCIGCQNDMGFVCQVGYDDEFFVGEFGQYWFYCYDCEITYFMMQST